MRLLTTMIIIGIGSVMLGCDKCETTDVQEDCICILLYDPVCGCDGKTYGNSCEAECAGVTEYEPGECGN